MPEVLLNEKDNFLGTKYITPDQLTAIARSEELSITLENVNEELAFNLLRLLRKEEVSKCVKELGLIYPHQKY